MKFNEKLTSIMSLTNEYALRLVEILKGKNRKDEEMEKDYEIDSDELQILSGKITDVEFINLVSSVCKAGEFNEKVIRPALEELSEKNVIHLTSRVKVDKKTKKVSYVFSPIKK